MKFAALVMLVALTACGFTACGYHVSGKTDLLPKNLHTIAIPAFTNTTFRYKLTDEMPEAFAREFITRTRFKIVKDVNQADMILRGSILNYSFNPTIFDPNAQRANVADLRVTMAVSLIERATGKVLYNRPNFEVKESYQIASPPVTPQAAGVTPVATQYYEESEEALRRAATRVSQQVITAIVENF